MPVSDVTAVIQLLKDTLPALTDPKMKERLDGIAERLTFVTLDNASKLTEVMEENQNRFSCCISGCVS